MMNRIEKKEYLNVELCKMFPEDVNGNGLSEEEIVEFFNEMSEICIQDQEEHRWYFVLDCIFKIGEKYFSFPKIKCKGENMSPSDVGCDFVFDDIIEVEPVEVKTIKYVTVK